MTLADFPAAQIAHARDCDQFRNQTSALAVGMPFNNLQRAASLRELAELATRMAEHLEGLEAGR